MSKFYLAGPMSGIPQFNFPAFDEAAKTLRDMGWDIVSPAELDNTESRAHALASSDGVAIMEGETWGTFLARDVKLIADEADGIVFMPDWHLSRGARLEAFVALLSGKTKFYYYDHGDVWEEDSDYIRLVLMKNMP